MQAGTKTVIKSIRMQQADLEDMETLSKRAGKDFSALASELIREGIKMRRCPGIVFATEIERTAKIAGSGLEVWEIISQYNDLGRDELKLREAFHWLSEFQIRAALGYYRRYPQEIDRQIELNATADEEYVTKKYPHLPVRP